MANNSQRGKNDRIREKFEKIKQFAREAVKITPSQQVSSDDGAELQSLRDAFQERELELQQQIDKANQREREAQQQILVMKEAEVRC